MKKSREKSLRWIPLSWCILFIGIGSTAADPNVNSKSISAWNILSSDIESGMKAIEKAPEYGINHLQLSHQLIMDLRDVRDEHRRTKTLELINAAHDKGIENVLVWDHALYDLDYYPDRFKTSDGRIDLDSPAFWQWFKEDYRAMLDQLPGLDGIVLTFIETGAHVEDQYSERLQSEGEKLAALVDEVAKVVIDEREMQLFIRTFVYQPSELQSLLECINLIQHPGVKVMTKEVPHDFFLTHPVSRFVKNINKPVLIEFDLAHEYNGQGIVASILPKIAIKRWKYYSQLPNVIGYVARTDRYGNTQLVGNPGEVNLFALRRIQEDPSLDAEQIVIEYVSLRYGDEAVPFLVPVFMECDEIIESIFYTLGLLLNDHSRFDFEHEPGFSRHCSANWTDTADVTIAHGVDQTFHYWQDIVEHLAPAKFKVKHRANGHASLLYQSIPAYLDDGGITPVEKMNDEYLSAILTEKEYGVAKAKWALAQVRRASSVIENREAYDELLHLFERTLLTAQLYFSASQIYYRIRMVSCVYDSVVIRETIEIGLEELAEHAEDIESYVHDDISGQFVWSEDAKRAMEMHRNLTERWSELEAKTSKHESN